LTKRAQRILAVLGAVLLATGLLNLLVATDGSKSIISNNSFSVSGWEGEPPVSEDGWSYMNRDSVYHIATKGGPLHIIVKTDSPDSIKVTFDGEEIPLDIIVDTSLGVHELRLAYATGSSSDPGYHSVNCRLDVKKAGIATGPLAYTLSLAAIGAVLLLYPRIASLVNSRRP